MHKKKKAATHYQFRSNLVSTVKLFDSIKQLITDMHKAELRKTPFWYLKDCMLEGTITEKMCRKYDKDIILILDTYSSQRSQFRIGKSYVLFTANDISLIFGIPNGTKPLDLKYAKRKSSDFISRRLQGSPKVSALQMKQHLHIALNGTTKTDHLFFNPRQHSRMGIHGLC